MELLFLIKEMNCRNIVINFHNVQLCNKVLCKDPKEQQHLIFFWKQTQNVLVKPRKICYKLS